MIQRITLWRAHGKTFDSPEKAMAHCDDVLSAALDRLAFSTVVLSPGQRLKLADAICRNRAELAGLMAYALPDDDTEEG